MIEYNYFNISRINLFLYKMLLEIRSHEFKEFFIKIFETPDGREYQFKRIRNCFNAFGSN